MPEDLTPLDAMEESAWRAFARFFVAAPRLLDEDLQRGAHMSLSAYSVTGASPTAATTSRASIPSRPDMSWC